MADGKGGDCMKKRTKFWLTVSAAFAVIGLFLALISFAVAGFSIYGYEMNHTYTEKTFTFSAMDLTKVQFSDHGMDLRIVPSSDEDFHLTCYVKGTDDYRVEVTEERVLQIEAKTVLKEWWKNMSVSFRSPKVETVLAVPAAHFVTDWKFELSSGDVLINIPNWQGDLSITTNSGRICLEQMVLSGNLSLVSESGDQFLRNCTAAQITLCTDSGDIHASQLTALKLTTQSESGEQSLQEINCRELHFTSHSGDVEGDNWKGVAQMQGSTESGDVDLFRVEVNNGSVTTHSGEVEIALHPQSCVVFATSRSGRIRLPAPNAGEGTLTVDTQSGDITVSVLP